MSTVSEQTTLPSDASMDGAIGAIGPASVSGVEQRSRRSLLGRVGRAKRAPILVRCAVAWLALVAVLAILADFLPLESYDKPIGPPASGPSGSFSMWLGTDGLGRSNMARVIYGARVSLAVGLISVAIGMTLGGLLGLFAGFRRGRFEKSVNVLTDSFLAFPPLVLLLAITATAGSSLPSLVLALGILSLPTFTRLARANTIAFAQREFVLASRALGARASRIVFRDLLPNVVLPVASYAFVVAAVVIVAEGSLSFLGLGLPPPTPSWGGMIAAGRDRLESDPMVVFVPAAVMFLTIFALNVVGDRARTRFDVRESAL
jgi:peptide/nickel transport system permease protein